MNPTPYHYYYSLMLNYCLIEMWFGNTKRLTVRTRTQDPLTNTLPSEAGKDSLQGLNHYHEKVNPFRDTKSFNKLITKLQNLRYFTTMPVFFVLLVCTKGRATVDNKSREEWTIHLSIWYCKERKLIQNSEFS